MEHNKLQEHVAKRIRECRKAKSLSQEKLSEKAGLGIKAIQNMENLKYDFKIQTLQKVIDALDLTVEEFFHFQFSEDTIKPETLLENITHLPEDKQSTIISSFNEIVKNIT
ncbi:helix-turn-helix domain-containing protein [Streptococcus hyointestinalis]|uniref:helix-turn-helix domain-containing protein n=1 Tax=Streptococcus hyointestinalis TaxID=1337 RepID=UPI0013DF540E|nr:helix-turn-helix transcriptional regulator [Streptococcus hyointestinalis]